MSNRSQFTSSFEKDSHFNLINTTMRFDRALNNVDNAKNSVTTVIFTGPVQGTYFFKYPEWLLISPFEVPQLYDKEIAVALYQNDIEIALALADEEGDADKEIETYDMESTLNQVGRSTMGCHQI